MSNSFIAFLFAIGVATWMFAKFQKRTGNNTQKAVGGAAVAGIIAFIIFLTILWSVN